MASVFKAVSLLDASDTWSHALRTEAFPMASAYGNVLGIPKSSPEYKESLHSYSQLYPTEGLPLIFLDLFGS